MKETDDKSEFLIIGNSCQRKYVQYNYINICNAQFNSTEKAHNLGVLFDKEMNLSSPINNIYTSGFYHIRNLAAIHNILAEESVKVVVHAFVTSTLDYGNPLLYMDYLSPK